MHCFTCVDVQSIHLSMVEISFCGKGCAEVRFHRKARLARKYGLLTLEIARLQQLPAAPDLKTLAKTQLPLQQIVTAFRLRGTPVTKTKRGACMEGVTGNLPWALSELWESCPATSSCMPSLRKEYTIFTQNPFSSYSVDPFSSLKQN